MFAYELQQARQADLQRRADAWRLARDAKAGRDDARRARRTAHRAATRTDAAEPEPQSVRVRPAAHGRLHRALHPHSAA
jgi:hypothetical protein